MTGIEYSIAEAENPHFDKADVGRGLRDDKATRLRRPICTVRRLEIRNQAFP
jgi:hypothetical protein